MHHVGVIPFDIKDQLTALLFVTSMSRGRWILPKGLMKAGECHEDTCHREGFEEAGVRGVVFTDYPVTALIKSPWQMTPVPPPLPDSLFVAVLGYQR